MSKAFAQAMSQLRRARGMSQREVAAGLGVSQALLSHYENGAREPTLDFVARICDYYGVSADYMLGRTGDPGGGAANGGELRELAQQLRALADKAELLAEGEAK
ncbi:MAG TPA: helix-turn-helix transcriptional regulator [Candidatus Scatomorpha gallistercoris]|nr:helix-turn-helix transcriptional regulator [Candidatus Scatomorpha gallistercoris]